MSDNDKKYFDILYNMIEAPGVEQTVKKRLMQMIHLLLTAKEMGLFYLFWPSILLDE